MTSPSGSPDIDTLDVGGPCVRVCKYNERNECFGCFRTNLEVRAWNRLTPTERDEISLQLDRRRDAYWSQFATPAPDPVQ